MGVFVYQYGTGVGGAEAALAEARRRHEGVVTGVSMAALGGSSGSLRDGAPSLSLQLLCRHI